MGKKDLSEKALMRHGDVFADIFNVLVFKKKLFNKENFMECSEKGLYLKK